MKLYGSLKELVSIVYREDTQEITVRPNQSTTYTAARDIQLPPGDADAVLTGAASTQTLTNKTIDGDDNTVQDLALTSLKTVLGDANKVLRRDSSGIVVSSDVTISDASILSGATQLNVDNLRLDGNTLSSTDTNGNVVLDPDGTGIISALAAVQVTGALRSDTSLILEETGAGTDTITVQAPASIGASYSLTLPVDDGNSGEVLSTDGNGVLSWIAAGAGDIINGGNTTGAAVTIGTNDAFALNLETNGTNKLTISSAGLVTIGASGNTATNVNNGNLRVVGSGATNNLAVAGNTTSGELVIENGSSARGGTMRYNVSNGNVEFGVNGSTGIQFEISTGQARVPENASTVAKVKLTNNLTMTYDRTGDGGSGETFYLAVNGGAATTFANSNFAINGSGRPFFRSHDTTGSAANAFLDSSTGQLLRSTSSLRYKEEIADLDLSEAEGIYDLRAVTYKSKSAVDDPTKRHLGFIAEEVVDVNPRLIHYNDGVVDGVQYERLTVLLVKALQDLKQRIEALEA